jgi:hypothetical protein
MEVLTMIVPFEIDDMIKEYEKYSLLPYSVYAMYEACMDDLQGVLEDYDLDYADVKEDILFKQLLMNECYWRVDRNYWFSSDSTYDIITCVLDVYE